MIGVRKRGTRSAGQRRRASLCPDLEALEGRLLLYAANGGHWTYSDRITYSFAPDGTDVGGHPNVLNQAMAARGLTTAQWKTAIRDAAALWESVADVNLVEVADSGAPFGTPGNQQDDPRFGDIRFFGTSWSPGTLGVSNLPPPFNGGTAAGDIILNTDQAWAIGQTYDVETVAIHEIGHALGLDHSAYSDAVMYAYYNGTKQFPTADDVGGIRSIYGARPQDWIDQFHDNKDPYNAVDISGLIVNGKETVTNLDVTSNQDSDWYYVKAPAGASGTMTITMQSSQLSSLSSRFQVYNSALTLAGWTVAPNPGTVYGSTISLRFTGVPAGTGVYIKAMGWNGPSSGFNGVGAYALQVDFTGGPTPTQIVNPPNTVVAERPDQGGGSSNLDLQDGFGIGLSDPASLVDQLFVHPTLGAGATASLQGSSVDFSWLDDPAIAPSNGTVAFPKITPGDVVRLLKGVGNDRPTSLSPPVVDVTLGLLMGSPWANDGTTAVVETGANVQDGGTGGASVVSSDSIPDRAARVGQVLERWRWS